MQKENRQIKSLTGGLNKVSVGPVSTDNKNRIDRIRRKVKKIGKMALMENLDGVEAFGLKIVKLTYNFRKKINDLGRNELKFEKKYKMMERVVDAPSTPHNTSQYLIHNYKKGRKEQVYNIISEYTRYLDEDVHSLMREGIIEEDDICVSGGSMKGIIESTNLDLLTLDSEENTTCTSQSCTSEDDLSCYSLSRKNSIQEVQINSYKQIIENQQKEIENLQTKINEFNRQHNFDPS